MFPIHTSATLASTSPSLYNPHSIRPSTAQPDTKMKKPSMPTSTTFPPALSLTNLQQEWPLEEYQEKRIMNALSQQQLLSPFLDEEYSDDDDTAEEEDVDSISPTASYFSDRALFQLNSTIRRQSLSNSLRCSICQRRFHSQGNLSNHTQLYHC
ncbi:C2H2-type zinc finger transcription factor [Mucor lusitanicus]|uniref:C2H2-type zinc finger transcription factor n=2 Tax=Mucor circinelloides f. lusitanicus TaxID=29924 RepID=A0A162QFC0_MUCCL|nr:C2H2-type zinc finger transcription factor [Mucor lusitanicus]OAD01570.1 C2H2-type zinc finger transcription factor [Mucor lusitanicus CBS 277.49]